jgi:hypothetical protein
MGDKSRDRREGCGKERKSRWIAKSTSSALSFVAHSQSVDDFHLHPEGFTGGNLRSVSAPEVRAINNLQKPVDSYVEDSRP